MGALAKEPSSFVKTLSTHPHPSAMPFKLKIGLTLVVLLSCTLPLTYFWDAYDAHGAMPWDHGFLSYPVPGAVPLPSRAEVALGMGWMSALIPAFLLGYTILLALLARRGKTLTTAGLAVVVLVGNAPLGIMMERIKGDFRAMDSTREATFAEVSHARSVLKAKGLDEDAKALRERLVRLLAPIPDKP